RHHPTTDVVAAGVVAQVGPPLRPQPRILDRLEPVPEQVLERPGHGRILRETPPARAGAVIIAAPWGRPSNRASAPPGAARSPVCPCGRSAAGWPHSPPSRCSAGRALRQSGTR